MCLHHLSSVPLEIPMSSSEDTSHRGSAFTQWCHLILISALKTLSPNCHIPRAEGCDFQYRDGACASFSNGDPSLWGKDRNRHRRGLWDFGNGYFLMQVLLPPCAMFVRKVMLFALPWVYHSIIPSLVTERHSQQKQSNPRKDVCRLSCQGAQLLTARPNRSHRASDAQPLVIFLALGLLPKALQRPPATRCFCLQDRN